MSLRDGLGKQSIPAWRELKDPGNDPKAAYTQFIARKMVFLGFCLALLVLLVLVSASLGGTTKGPYEVLQAVAARFLPVESDPFVMGVVWHLRLPRVFLGVAAGIGLAISGAAMQGVTRNPLVSPFTVGISSAAAFGASMAIMFGVGYASTGTYIIILCCLCRGPGLRHARLRPDPSQEGISRDTGLGGNCTDLLLRQPDCYFAVLRQ